MPTLKQLINRYLYTVALLLIILSLMIVSIIQIKLARDQIYSEALTTLEQIEEIMIENQEELKLTKREYSRTCLLNAKVISRFIQNDPSILYDIEELKTIAKHLEIDEIHIFDETGTIFTGTHPEYYGFNFDSGEQMAFFKPLLNSKSLEAVQDITPNTAEDKLMQYSALWSKNGKYIIQIGMEPVTVEKLTHKNELSHIFSHFRVTTNVSYYAINKNTGLIEASSQLNSIGINCSDIGFSLNDIKNDNAGIYVTINGTDNYCVFHQVDDVYICYALPTQYIFADLPYTLLALFVSMIAIAFILLFTFNEYMRIHITEKLQKINQQLCHITNGDLKQIIDVRNVSEFSDLSTNINNLVQVFANSNSKLTNIFRKTNVFIGTYEYNETSESVQFSEYIPELFALDSDALSKFSADKDSFKEFIAILQANCLPNETDIVLLENKYLKIDEIVENGYVLGVVMDVTDSVNKQLKLETKIHLDSLTGLFNSKGMETELTKLFETPASLNHYAVISIMAEGLSKINTDYGYETGDLYIRTIGELISDFGIKKSLAARQGGGEFFLFLYGYENEKDLIKAIQLLTYLQSHSVVKVDENTKIPVEFTFGYSISNTTEHTDYHTLLKQATSIKYNNHYINT